jgi:hypothetical protein
LALFENIVPVWHSETSDLIRPCIFTFKEIKHGLFDPIWKSQVKLLITNNAFYIVQRATAHSKTGIFRGNDVAEAPQVS